MLTTFGKHFARGFAEAASKATKKKAAAAFGRKALPGIGRILMTTSCKGGVGKSTVALNTALALQKAGMRVGLFDADIYGPSVPTMLNTEGKPLYSDAEGNFIPVENYGMPTVSVGYGIGPKMAMLWKGPIVGKVISDFLRNAIWPELDYLVLDTPPGTGDVLMSIAQNVPVDGAIVVTQPQNVAVADVERNFDMFKHLKIKPVGIIQNMDGFRCAKCKTVTKIFPGDGAANLSKKYNVPLIGSIPIDPEIASSGDKGVPALLAHPDSEYAKIFEKIAKHVIEAIPKQKPRYPARQPVAIEKEESK
ncbi:mrp, putative [Trichomonas vaginalis G3]|uniref:Mrp, putative n=1 Tax=Trichomonas vaginalis (strain ATCC PRA-98 / G3) TaxID=412133 RepID=A2FTU7_TRIV3|nr:NUBPL iron-transfer P-loop NTPase (ParA) family [Trichomonas vaginalis G3]EAX91668.1 mrp, putative [Trichomonas vaginalis G3]KAI5487246.1 NUBPL iron-transfer P-loop NTPase (ParA) family [Trichomonas vaginalis G3]|eukprot:XP_001304598.1 mrp [Trichomonas vaginalis G3]